MDGYWFIACIISTIFFFIVLFLFSLRSRYFWSYQGMFFVWTVIVCLLGVPIMALLSMKYGFHRSSSQSVCLSVLYALGILSIFLISTQFSSSRLKVPLFFNVRASEIKVFGWLLVLSSIFSLLYYANVNGLVLRGLENYAQRYQSNRGYGVLSRLFPMYTLGFTVLILFHATKARWLLYLLVGVILGFAVYVVMGGYRQILAIHVLVFFVIGMQYGYISKLKVFTGVLTIPVVLSLLATVRYSSAELSGDSVFTFLVFTLDSFSPFDSFLKIKAWVDTNGSQGLAPILNEFLALVPRTLWADKPLFMLNSGNFYTQEILKYGTSVTISPTFMGSLYLVGGNVALFVGVIVTGWILKFCDANFNVQHISVKYPGSIVRKSVFYFSIFYIFALAREGVEVFLQRIVITLLLVYVFLMLSKLVTSMCGGLRCSIREG